MRNHGRALCALTLYAIAAAAEAQPAWRATDRATGMLSEARRGRDRSEGFFGSVAAGYVANHGSTENSTLHAKGSLGFVAGQWRHAVMLRTLYSSSDEQPTAEEYEAAEQTDYTFLGTDTYVFASFNYQVSVFGSYRRRASQVIGAGRRFVDTSSHVLDVQLGAGARQTDPGGGEDISETIGRVDGSYVWKVSKETSFQQQLSVERGPENTYSESLSELKTNLRDDLALSVSFTARHNSRVPEGAAHTDTASLVSLIYSF